MKSAFLRIFCILSAIALAACAGLGPINPEEKTFSAVYEAPGATEKRIFDGTKVWIAENFRSSKSVIDHENAADGLIISKGSIPYPCAGIECAALGHWAVNFTMRSDIKDGRFLLTFSNLELSMPERAELRMRKDLDAVKPILLAFGPEIVKSIASDQQRKNF